VHTLHTPYPVSRIAIRPEHDTEVVVLPFHGGAAPTTAPIYEIDDLTPEFDRFAPQIWDVRKGWVAKWGMSGILGPATGRHLYRPCYGTGLISLRSGRKGFTFGPSSVQVWNHRTARPSSTIQTT